jgi:hypothetical protein
VSARYDDDCSCSLWVVELCRTEVQSRVISDKEVASRLLGSSMVMKVLDADYAAAATVKTQ